MFDAVFADFFFASKLLEPGGYVVFDDCDSSWPGVLKMKRYLTTARANEFALISRPGPNSFCAFQKRRQDERSWKVAFSERVDW